MTAAPQNPQKTTASPRLRKPPSRIRPHILMIDDEPQILDVVRSLLGARGFEVLTATNGADGLQQAVEEHPRLILLDIRMPVMDGYVVLFHLKHHPQTKHIPVIMLTAIGETSSIFRTKELQATDYMIKPFDVGELATLIRRYI